MKTPLNTLFVNLGCAALLLPPAASLGQDSQEPVFSDYDQVRIIGKQDADFSDFSQWTQWRAEAELGQWDAWKDVSLSELPWESFGHARLKMDDSSAFVDGEVSVWEIAGLWNSTINVKSGGVLSVATGVTQDTSGELEDGGGGVLNVAAGGKLEVLGEAAPEGHTAASGIRVRELNVVGDEYEYAEFAGVLNMGGGGMQSYLFENAVADLSGNLTIGTSDNPGHLLQKKTLTLGDYAIFNLGNSSDGYKNLVFFNDWWAPSQAGEAVFAISGFRGEAAVGNIYAQTRVAGGSAKIHMSGSDNIFYVKNDATFGGAGMWSFEDYHSGGDFGAVIEGTGNAFNVAYNLSLGRTLGNGYVYGGTNYFHIKSESADSKAVLTAGNITLGLGDNRYADDGEPQFDSEGNWIRDNHVLVSESTYKSHVLIGGNTIAEGTSLAAYDDGTEHGAFNLRVGIGNFWQDDAGYHYERVENPDGSYSINGDRTPSGGEALFEVAGSGNEVYIDSLQVGCVRDIQGGTASAVFGGDGNKVWIRSLNVAQSAVAGGDFSVEVAGSNNQVLINGAWWDKNFNIGTYTAMEEVVDGDGNPVLDGDGNVLTQLAPAEKQSRGGTASFVFSGSGNTVTYGGQVNVGSVVKGGTAGLFHVKGSGSVFNSYHFYTHSPEGLAFSDVYDAASDTVKAGSLLRFDLDDGGVSRLNIMQEVKIDGFVLLDFRNVTDSFSADICLISTELGWASISLDTSRVYAVMHDGSVVQNGTLGEGDGEFFNVYVDEEAKKLMLTYAYVPEPAAVAAAFGALALLLAALRGRSRASAGR